MNKLERIQRGESQPVRFHRNGDSIDGWTCTMTVKQYPEDTATINRVLDVADDGISWETFLTADETNGLTPGLWFVTGSLVNLSTNEMEQKVVRLDVAPAWTP